jgi:hypothetical protein
MDTKLDCEADVEGAVDMVGRGEEGHRQVGALACALIQPTHSPRASKVVQRPMNAWACRDSMLPSTRSSPDQFPVYIYFAGRRSLQTSPTTHHKRNDFWRQISDLTMRVVWMRR